MIGYKRILLKLSGESLAGEKGAGIDESVLHDFAVQIKEISMMGAQTGIVIGGGNIFRGMQGAGKGYDRVRGDQMGMLATVINSLALQSALENLEMPSAVLTSIRMEPVGELYSSAKARELMNKGFIVIIAGGTGNPFFTTDTAAALRAAEVRADVLLKGTRVDGVYDSDPEKNPGAEMFKEITFTEAINRKLHVLDLTAFTLCMENNLPVVVFNMNIKENLKKIISGEDIGTLVKNQ